MFKVDQGLGAQWPAPEALSPEPSLEFTADRHTYSGARYDHGQHDSAGKPRRRIALVLALAMILGAAGLWCRLTLSPAGETSNFRAQLDGLARMTGLGIDMVVLTGHRFTTDSDIFDALDLPNARSLVSFDTEGVRRRLERLPWVLSADLTRVFPDRLDVRVSERKAFAVWTREGQAQLIDKSGRVLSAIGNGKSLDLPRVSGEGAAAEAEIFLTLLAQTPDLYARLDEAERVGDRRWTLHLSDGVTVHLPPEREGAVLATLSKGGTFASLIAKPNRIVDLRASGRIALREDRARATQPGPHITAAEPSPFGVSIGLRQALPSNLPGPL